MRMINDVDLYYDCMNTKNNMPQWMAAERMNYCEGAATLRKTSIFDLIAKLFA